MAAERSLSERFFFCKVASISILLEIDVETHIVFRNQREERDEGLIEVCAKGIGKGSDKVSSRRDENRVILGLVFGCLFLLVLIRILLAECLLFEDLHSNAADRVVTFVICKLKIRHNVERRVNARPATKPGPILLMVSARPMQREAATDLREGDLSVSGFNYNGRGKEVRKIRI